MLLTASKRPTVYNSRLKRKRSRSARNVRLCRWPDSRPPSLPLPVPHTPPNNNDRCGTLAEALCNNLDGCYDPGTGDYDVTVPVDQVSGTYKLQVKNRDDQTAHCSDSFFVTGETGAVPTLAPAETPVQTRSPTPAPFFPATPSPVVPTEAPVVPLTRAPSPEPTPQPVAPPAAQPVVPPTPRTAPPTQDTTPIVLPNPVPAKVECDDSAELSFKYTKESSTKLPLITVTHASGDRTENGCLTLTMLYEWLQTAPSDVLPVSCF